MKKCMTWLLGSLLLTLALPVVAAAQDCDASIIIDYLSTDRDGLETFSLGVYLANTCDVGGIQFDIITDPPNVIRPLDADTTGGRISYWEVTGVGHINYNRLRFFGFADFPDQNDTPALPEGTGLICNVIFDFGCDYLTNGSVSVMFDSVRVFDTTGYDQFPTMILNSVVDIGSDVTPIERGDANCDGHLFPGDISYLVQYFSGNVDCACSFCAGDANGDGYIVGGDVTYLVNYFGGINPPPRDCDQ